MNRQVEYTDKAVTGLPCAYGNLLEYSNDYTPGTQFKTIKPGTAAPAGTRVATDGNNQPLTDIYGNLYLVDPHNNPIPLPPNANAICGGYNTLGLAYHASQ